MKLCLMYYIQKCVNRLVNIIKSERYSFIFKFKKYETDMCRYSFRHCVQQFDKPSHPAGVRFAREPTLGGNPVIRRLISLKYSPGGSVVVGGGGSAALENLHNRRAFVH